MDMTEVKRWQEYVQIRDKHIKKQDAEIAELWKLIFEAHDLLITGRKFSTTPIAVLNWSIAVQAISAKLQALVLKEAKK